MTENSIQAELTDNAVNYLADKGYEPQFGARPIKRILQKEVINELAKEILADKIQKNSIIIIDVENKQLIFRNK